MLKLKKAQMEFRVGGYEFNSNSRELKYEGETVKLSSIEAKLLQLFCENKNDLVTRDFVLTEIWQDDDHLKSRSLNVYITKLRNFFKKRF